ncbi:ABC transporter ATP-binding protein [Yoonia sp.]|uniref:ABC transporter ATP-binding protein n=1 Tax=Yoonia sp. TaxID=2212373 RepID=UPI00391D3865
MTAPVLCVQGLRVSYGASVVVHDVSFTLAKGETLALVGLSGCGKTTILRAILGLLPPSAQIVGTLTTPEGSVALADLTALRKRLGREIGFVAQNPFDACAPLRTVRAHIAESWRAHGLTPDPARVTDLCRALGLPDEMLDRYPHEWSGGMLQRANIAAAVALKPPVLVADEPTSAVDADRARNVMSCLRMGAPGVLIVSHDLPLVEGIADRVLLIENGRITAATTGAALAQGKATAALRDFAAFSATRRPLEPATEPVLDVENLTLERGGKRVVSDISFRLRAGEVLGVAGPSGGGKSTLLSALAGHIAPAGGVIRRFGNCHDRGQVLPLFQDALTSMNPHWALARIVAEPLTVGANRMPFAQRRQAAVQALRAFGLGHVSPDGLPGQLSTGQCQRVVLARASLARPALVLADEPTSALDPRQKAAALNGLARLAAQGAAIVLVSHDRPLLRGFCHAMLELA